MANIIQIKRSATTAVPASLANGELAYSGNTSSNSLFIGDVATGSPIRIGGGKYVFLHQSNTSAPGALTSNAVVITNGNSFVTDWKTNALTVGVDGATLSIANITSVGNATHLGTASNTELATTWAIKTYIDAVSGAATIDGLTDVTISSAANNNILVYDAASGQWENHTISGTANEVTATFSGQNLTVGLAANVTIANTLTVTGVANLAANASVGGDLRVVGAMTVDGDVTLGNNVSDALIVTGKVQSSLIPFHSTTYNLGNSSFFWDQAWIQHVEVDATLSVGQTGTNVSINTTSISVGNSTVNTQITAGDIKLNGSQIALGNSTVNTVITDSSISTTGTIAGGNTTIAGFINVSTTGYFGNNVTIAGVTNTGPLNVSGNLTVTGTLTTVTANNLVVQDSLIQLANGNVSTDVLDIGFYGSYNDGTNVEYTGLFRDANDGKYNLFKSLEAAPGTTVDTTNTTFEFATLKSYLESSALITNATSVAITANSTINVNIVANTLTLSTPLAVGSGGTGVSTFTANGVMYANSSGSGVAFATGSDGQVLQLSSGAPVFAGLDGGTF